MKNIPIITFLQRTWLLVLAWFAADWIALTQHHFSFLGDWQFNEMRGWEWVARTPSECFGAEVYVPSLVLLVALCPHVLPACPARLVSTPLHSAQNDTRRRGFLLRE
ncbi:MAG: hypothetical protein ABJF10_24555 [Chthoniobacter sp.]|uniref:hypothetical protein n=1 Tax=Chthoniobacter sp. TaxID=2510640 RepID=UPI0032A587A7